MRECVWLVGAILLGSCGGKEAAPAAAQPPEAAAGLSPFELEHGIGPITAPVQLGAVDESMAAAGQVVFEQKCSACHKMEEKYVGPALGEVTERRSAAFILNIILNPQEMIERHPVVKQLVAEHLTFMPNQGVSQDEARQVLEYLRTQDR
ncbi:MAG TPA: cytochrome c [Gemmatimonadales bacterium]|jgi:mono/diheme cytochrome c family protein